MFGYDSVDIDRLREDMENESLGAFFGGGFGGALIEAGDIGRMSSRELIDYAQKNGYDLSDYEDDADED